MGGGSSKPLVENPKNTEWQRGIWMFVDNHSAYVHVQQWMAAGPESHWFFEGGDVFRNPGTNDWWYVHDQPCTIKPSTINPFWDSRSTVEMVNSLARLHTGPSNRRVRRHNKDLTRRVTWMDLANIAQPGARYNKWLNRVEKPVLAGLRKRFGGHAEQKVELEARIAQYVERRELGDLLAFRALGDKFGAHNTGPLTGCERFERALFFCCSHTTPVSTRLGPFAIPGVYGSFIDTRDQMLQHTVQCWQKNHKFWKMREPEMRLRPLQDQPGFTPRQLDYLLTHGALSRVQMPSADVAEQLPWVVRGADFGAHLVVVPPVLNAAPGQPAMVSDGSETTGTTGGDTVSIRLSQQEAAEIRRQYLPDPRAYADTAADGEVPDSLSSNADGNQAKDGNQAIEKRNRTKVSLI